MNTIRFLGMYFKWKCQIIKSLELAICVLWMSPLEKERETTTGGTTFLIGNNSVNSPVCWKKSKLNDYLNICLRGNTEMLSLNTMDLS